MTSKGPYQLRVTRFLGRNKAETLFRRVYKSRAAMEKQAAALWEEFGQQPKTTVNVSIVHPSLGCWYGKSWTNWQQTN